MDQFQYNLAGMFLWWPSIKIVQAVMIHQKTWPLGGQSLLSLYICIENFKNVLVINQWTNFNIIWQECFIGDPLARLFKPKTWLLGQGLFSLYIYIENFKNLLVRNHWTGFSVTWQECCFDDLPPRLFKPS